MRRFKPLPMTLACVIVGVSRKHAYFSPALTHRVIPMTTVKNCTEDLLRYKQWADNAFLETVSHVPRDQLKANRPIVFGSLIRTLNHSCAMDYVWQCHLLGRAHGLTSRNPESCPEFDELRARQLELDDWFVEYAKGLTDCSLEQYIDFTFIGGRCGRMKRRDILLHVVNHGTYHRGHAADMLYTLGIFPPTTDLPVFLAESEVT